MSIKVSPTGIEGALLFTPPVFEDDRGFFKETFVQSKYAALGIADSFVQDSVSVSRLHVIRGLHADPAMSKLVCVLHGEVYDVIVDARASSPTFGTWKAFRLSSENHHQLYLPPGCLHGFQALSDGAVFCYKQSAEYEPSREIGVIWNDEQLKIAWPDPRRAIVSAKDGANRSFAEVVSG